MDGVTLKQLRYFEAVARHGHFGRAAETCAISQPALSVQIKELEATLGAQLFERGPRQVRLTAFGAEFAARVRTALREVEALGEFARTAQDGLAGHLRLGVIPTVAPYLLPAVIARLSARYPGIDLGIRETLTERLLAEVQDGRLDAAIVALPVSEAGLEEAPLFEEPFVLVRPKADADKPVPTADGLREMRLLLLEEGHCFREQALSFCAPHPLRGRGGMDGTSLTTLVQMVGAGLGVTLIPAMAVPVETKSAAVSVAGFGKNGPSRQVGLIWRRSSGLAAQMGDVVETLRGVERDRTE